MTSPSGARPQTLTVQQGLLELVKSPAGAVALALPFLLVAWFYGFQGYFEANHGATVLRWLTLSWNERNELEHAWLVPPMILFLIYSQRHTLAANPFRPAPRAGLLLCAFAGLVFLASIRTLQPRLAVGALPFFLLGIVCYHTGRHTAKSLAIPLGLIYFTVPIPGLTQATNGLQLLATNFAYQLSRLVGVDLVRAGNQLASTTDKWGFDVAEGCSGLRSLLALTLVAAVYAYLTQNKPLKGLLLFASSIPLAIIANAIRVATIIILAEYVSPTFAGGIYHDWAGFLFFLAVGLSGLILVDRLINYRASTVAVRHIKNEAPSAP